MLIPSYVKKQSISIFNTLPEIERKKNYKETFIGKVAITGTIANDQFSKTRSPVAKDTLTFTVDTKDIELMYQPYAAFDLNPTGWTVHPEDDYLVFKGLDLAIVSFKETYLMSKLRFVEMTCKRK